MKKHGLCAVAVVAAAFGFSGVSAHAQDVTNTASAQTVYVAPTAVGAPAATPAPTPQFLSDEGKFAFFAGYSFLDTNITQGNDDAGDCNDICYGRTEGSGFALQGTYFLNPNFGLTADFSGNYGGVTNNDGTDRYHLPQNSYYILFGPTVAKKVGKVELSAHGLAGVARLWAAEDETAGGTFQSRVPWTTGFSVGLGGSADWMFTNKVGWRVAQIDWLWSDGAQFSGTYSEHVSVEAVRLSTGIIFNFGRSR